jgi:hypothetical protein
MTSGDEDPLATEEVKMNLFRYTMAVASLIVVPKMAMAQEEAPNPTAPPPKATEEIFGQCKFWDNDLENPEISGHKPECTAKFRWCREKYYPPTAEAGAQGRYEDCSQNFLRVKCDHNTVFYGTADADTDGKVTLTGNPSERFPVPPVLSFENPKKIPTKVKAWLDVNRFSRTLKGKCELKEAKHEREHEDVTTPEL